MWRQETKVHSQQNGHTFVPIFKPIHLEKDQVLEVSDVDDFFPRKESKYLKFSGKQIKLRLDQVKNCQSRQIDYNPEHVNQIKTFKRKRGSDPRQTRPAVTLFEGEYYRVNGHHQGKSDEEDGYIFCNFDLYDYTGKQDLFALEMEIDICGKAINTDEPPRSQMKPSEFEQSAKTRIAAYEKQYGVPCLYVDENDKPIKITKHQAELYLEEVGFTNYWSPDMGGGRAGQHTKSVKKILKFTTGQYVSKIKSVSEKRLNDILKANPEYNTKGNLTSTGYKGFCYKTNTASADGSKLFVQMARTKGNCTFLTFNDKELADPNVVLKQEEVIYQTAYNTYLDAIQMHNDLLELEYGERLGKKYSTEPAPPEIYWKYLKGKRGAVTQLNNERGDIIERKIVTKGFTIMDNSKEKDSIPLIDDIMNI